MKKTLQVYVGTDITMTTPTHPLACAEVAKRYIDKIQGSPEKKFEIRTNSAASVRILNHYGKSKGMQVKFFINGKKATFEEVLDDFNRAEAYIDNLMAEVQSETKGIVGESLFW